MSTSKRNDQSQFVTLKQAIDAMQRNGYVILGIIGLEPKLSLLAFCPKADVPEELVSEIGRRLGDVVANVSTTRPI